MPTGKPTEKAVQIVKAAYEYMLQVMQVPPGKIANPRVEELEQAEEAQKKYWNVVLSYDVIGNFEFEKTREYKKFRVDDNGIVLDMKIKKV